MAMNRIFLSIGSNLGNRRKNLDKALKLLEEKAGQIRSRSAIYETEPWGFRSDLFFYNQAVELLSALDPLQLLDVVHDIEKLCGRKRLPGRYTPRPADLDILFFNDSIISTPDLVVPHPALHLRRFVLVPLSEIAPGWLHPVMKKSILQLLQSCEDQNAVVRLSP